jgi:hypothetical protein
VKKLSESDKRLRIYLNDHAALMFGELELVRRCRHSNRNIPLSEFLERMHVEVKAQRSVVKDVMHRIGGRESLIKGSGAWLAEKLGRFKLNGTVLTYSSLSRVLELETLAAAALERIAVWDNLDAIAAADERLAGISFGFFRQQSREHLDELNTRRKHAAVEALKVIV